MAKPKVTVGGIFNELKNIDEMIVAETMTAVGQTIVRDAKASIARGQSPVEGYGAFPKYKDPEKYPGRRKRPVPVNLKLEGDMLNAYKYKRTSKLGLAVGVMDDRKQEAKARAHNEGTEDIPQRRFIPGEGEAFIPSITRKVVGIIQRRLDLLIRQKNKKG